MNISNLNSNQNNDFTNSNVNLSSDNQIDDTIHLKLNHPYFMYPNGPLSEYNNFIFYNNEIKRLYLHFFNLKKIIEEKMTCANIRILNPIIVGSAMEQSIKTNNNDSGSFFQWQQLFPSYIINFIDSVKSNKNLNLDNQSNESNESNESNKSNQTNPNSNPNQIIVNLIIISPDNFFSDEHYNDPIFINMPLFEFKKISNRKYIYENQKENLIINVDIFNCPLPSRDTRECLKKISDFFISTYDNLKDMGISTYVQSESDVFFINNFYSMIDNFLSLNNNFNNITIINSWATFKNLDGFNNFRMFRELLDISNKNNILATEWTYRDKMVFTKILSNFTCDLLVKKNKSIQKRCNLLKQILYINYEDFEYLMDFDKDFEKNFPRNKHDIYYNILFDNGIYIYEM
jgi:hypothetical protein